MADWGKILSRGNVEDRRGFAPVAGGLSLTGLALIVAFNFLTGGDLSDLLQMVVNNPPVQTESRQVTNQYDGNDEYEQFASTVLGSNDDVWEQKFVDADLTYAPPRLVLFRTATESACGTASSQVGPHYCPLDQTIYIDETFFDELTNRLGAQGGDVAEAYVISHEVGHHVQNQLQVLDNRNSNEDSIRVELQADCYAGVWANSLRDENVFEPGEIQEAMDAAAAVGDDRIQERVTGQINPERWTHGSSADRMKWFATGYETGSVSRCNTFQ
jgi:predicted metalloprotease